MIEAHQEYHHGKSKPKPVTQDMIDQAELGANVVIADFGGKT